MKHADGIILGDRNVGQSSRLDRPTGTYSLLPLLIKSVLYVFMVYWHDSSIGE